VLRNKLFAIPERGGRWLQNVHLIATAGIVLQKRFRHNAAIKLALLKVIVLLKLSKNINHFLVFYKNNAKERGQALTYRLCKA
jgi:hypothetical protein